MRSPIACMAAALLALLLTANAHAETPPVTQGTVREEPAQPDPVALLDQTEKIVSERYYNRAALPAFRDTLDSYRETARTAADVGTAIAEALRTLGGTHTGRFTPDQIEYYELMDIFRPAGTDKNGDAIVPGGRIDYAGIGMVPRRIDGRLFVAQLYGGAPALKAGLRVGDEILSVDGKPYEPIASFKDHVFGSVTFQIRRHADAPPLDIGVPVVQMYPNRSLREAIRQSVRIIEQDGRRIGYLRIWTYAAGGMNALLTEILSSETLRSTDGLVLDLRSRWGGSASEAAEFFLGRARDMTVIDRNGKEKAVIARFRKPLVAIVDQNTRSSMEIFAYSLQQAGVPLIGTKTAGAVLAARAFLLDDHSLLELAVSDVKIDGKQLEGAGVTPGIAVPFDIRYAAGADPQFDRALIELTRILNVPAIPI